MRSRPAATAVLALITSLASNAVATPPTTQTPPPPTLHADGDRWADAAGRPVVLRGCNLGNWLILESWMFGGTLTVHGKPFKDGVALSAALAERFGPDRAAALLDAYRAAYVTPRDFDVIRSFGFNAVRLPFDYRLLEDDAGRTKPDAFRWLDRALDMAEAAGVYVVLDLHGAPGGQSTQDHTGQADRNRLWADRAAQDRTVELWRRIAERYRGRSVIAAYDLLNEPYGDFKQDLRRPLAELMPRIAAAVRDTGDEHVLLFPGVLGGGIDFYADPAGRFGDVGFTEHYYPGLFGDKPALETHARVLGHDLPVKHDELVRRRAPYLVGEFNVVLASEAPDRLMRRYYDLFAGYGWAGTMWSYKLIKTDAGVKPSGWYLVTNAGPLPTVDVATADAARVESFFAALATGPLAVNGPLRLTLTATAPPALPLARYTPKPEPDESTVTGGSLLRNGSFEAADDGRPAAWNRWGDLRRAETDAHNDRAVAVLPAGDAGLWQDVPAKAGGRYALTAFVRTEKADAGPIELRLESVTPDGPVTLNSQSLRADAGPGEWHRLSVHGTATAGTLRALVARHGGEGGVRVDSVTLTPIDDGH